MKKLMILSSLLCVTMIAAAQLTGTSQIKLTSAGQPDKYVRFVMSDSYSDAVDPAGDVEAANPGGIYVYKSANDTRWTQWASNAYSNNLVIGFQACDNTSYTLKFSSFTGIKYSIYDAVAKKTIDVDGDSEDYPFTIDGSLKNQPINDRFIINYVPAPSSELEACFKDNHLTISNNPWKDGKIVVYDGDDEVVKKDGTETDIPLTTLTADKHYTVKFFATSDTSGDADKTLIIVPVTLP